MADISLQPTEKSPIQAVVEKTSRLFYIDHLRAALVTLVVLHHVAVVYVGGIPFYYADPPKNESLGQLALLLFVLFNQAWFMGALFLLAGYFTPGSFERKGPAVFLKDRLVRLGIPLIIFTFVLGPISTIGIWLEPAPWITDPLTWQSYWQTYPELIDVGPLWFVALLLIFSFGYAAWRNLIRNRTSSSLSESSLPGYLTIGIFILALALVSYLVRIIIPLGKTVFGFPTLSYLPQYLSFFVVGAVASRRNWFRTLPNSMGVVGLVTALAASLLLFPPAFMSVFSGEFHFGGFGTWQSALYALWDSTFAVGMVLVAITLFRRFFNRESSFGRFLSRQSYAVYIIHSPIIVVLAFLLYLAYALRGIDLGPLLKFSIATAIVVPTCFAAAYIIRKIPGVSRIL